MARTIIRFSKTAEQTFRELPRADQRSIAEWLEQTSHSATGPSPVANKKGGVLTVRIGNHVLNCVAQEPSTIVVASIEELIEAPTSLVKRWSRLTLKRPLRESVGARQTIIADFASDVRFGVRMLFRKPVFALAVVVTLAIGLGGNAAVIGVVNNVYFSDLPFANGHELLRLRDYSLGPSGEIRPINMSGLNFFAIRSQNTVFTEVVAQQGHSYTYTGGETPARLSGIRVSRNWTATLGVSPMLGRSFAAEEEILGPMSGVVLVSHAFWQQELGATPEITNQSIVLNGIAHEVIGVMPPRFHYPYSADIWAPGHFDQHDGRGHDLNVVARLHPGETLESARTQLDEIAGRSAQLYPGTNRGWGHYAEMARDNFIADQDRMVVAILAAAGFLLLITCVNVTGVMVVHFLARHREIGLRAALGASRGRQIRQMMTENLLIFGLGGISGVVLMYTLRDYLTSLVPGVLRGQLDLAQIRLGWVVITFTAGLALACGLLFGLITALRTSSPRFNVLLRNAGSSDGKKTRFGGGLLVTAQIALALVLLVSAGTMIQHFRSLQRSDLGFEPSGLLTMRVNLQGSRYQDAASRSRLLEEIHTRIGVLPGVRDFGVTTVNPLCCGDWAAVVEVEGVTVSEDTPIRIHHRRVTSGLLEAMGIPLLRGRTFSEHDNMEGPRVAIVDQRMAQHFWPNDDALGKRVRWNRENEPWYTVVGVVGEVRDAGDYVDTWYVPYHQNPLDRSTDNLHLMIRADVLPNSIVRPVQEAIAQIDPTLATYETTEMDRLYAGSLSTDRVSTVTVALFASFGLLLAALGVYGLVSFLVSQRTREIGMRMALGAQRRDIWRIVLANITFLTAIGLTIGVACAFLTNRLMVRLLAELPTLDWRVLVVAVGLIVLTTAIATFVPGWRAVRLPPTIALRQ